MQQVLTDLARHFYDEELLHSLWGMLSFLQPFLLLKPAVLRSKAENYNLLFYFSIPNPMEWLFIEVLSRPSLPCVSVCVY